MDCDQLKSRLYHFLWKIWPKEKTIVGGIEIEYITLPSSWIEQSMTIVRHSTQSQMIFIRRTKEFRPLTIYHEYMESCAMLGIGIFADKDYLLKTINQAVDSIRTEIPDIEDRVMNFVRHTGDRPHALALILELALAKREMPATKYDSYYRYAIAHRL